MAKVWKNRATSIIFTIGFIVTDLALGYMDASSCHELDFPCNNGDCIEAELWCDSHEDCSDGSDEAYCKKITIFNKIPNKCSNDFFKCGDGPCIPLRGRCDGYKSCDDNSDEENCHIFTSFSSDSITSSPVVSFNMVAKSEDTLAHLLRNLTVVHKRNISLSRLFSQRHENFGWGDETPRMLTALYLSDAKSLLQKNKTDMLMIKQLEMQLLLAMVKNMTKNMADPDLALYINALLASCKDPTNFYGTNLVNILRYNVNSAQDDERFVSPAVYLTLSINNVTSKRDVRELQDFFSRQDDINNRLDIQALAMLAVSSAFNTNLIPAETYDSLKIKFLETLNSKNLLGNIYEAALTLQVLLELKLNETESKVSKLVDFLLRQQQPDGSFESILATYLVLPILSGQNLLKIGKWCDARPSTDLTPIEVLTNPGHQRKGLKYILKIGNPVEVSQTLQMQVPKNIHFLDVMRLAQDISPQYRFLLNVNHDVPVVYSIGGIPNDAERGTFWKLYVASSFNNSDVIESRLTPYMGNIKELIPKEDDEIVFWFKPTFSKKPDF